MTLDPKFSSLLRVVLLAAAATAHHYSCTSPTAVSKSDQALDEKTYRVAERASIGEGKEGAVHTASKDAVLHEPAFLVRWMLKVASLSRVRYLINPLNSYQYN